MTDSMHTTYHCAAFAKFCNKNAEKIAFCLYC